MGSFIAYEYAFKNNDRPYNNGADVMKKIMLAALMIITGSAVSMHTSLIAMESGPKTQIVNNADRPIEVVYTRAKDNRERVRTVSPGNPLVIEQYPGNPVNQMTLRTRGDKKTDIFSRGVKSDDINALSKSTGTIYVGSYKLNYSVEIVGQKPITFFGQKPKAFTFEELGEKPKGTKSLRDFRSYPESTKGRASERSILTPSKEMGHKIQVVNTGHTPFEIVYTRVKDNRERVITVSPENPHVIEQYPGNPVNQMTLRTTGDKKTDIFSRGVKSEDINALSKSIGTIYVSSHKLSYQVQMVGQKPIHFLGQRPKAFTFEELENLK